MMEWHPVFKTGSSHIQIPFTGGHLCGGARTPATFETDNPVIQTIIEKSDYFKSHLIASEEIPDSRGKKTVFEYRKESEVYAMLEDKHGVPAESLRNFTECERAAAGKGIVLRRVD